MLTAVTNLDWFPKRVERIFAVFAASVLRAKSLLRRIRFRRMSLLCHVTHATHAAKIITVQVTSKLINCGTNSPKHPISVRFATQALRTPMH